MKEESVVTPKQMLDERGFDKGNYFSNAFITFRNYDFSKGLIEKLDMKEFREKLLSNINPETSPAIIYAKDDIIGVTQVLWGGPQTAIILEELGYLGVKNVIGVGASGSLEKTKLGSLFIAESGFCSDGTSKDYTEKEEVYADKELLRIAREITKDEEDTIFGRVWATDAIYREFPSMVELWRNRGASAVNYETSSLYAVAEDKDMKAIYLSNITDLVIPPWTGWHRDYKESNERLQNTSIKILKEIQNKKF